MWSDLRSICLRLQSLCASLNRLGSLRPETLKTLSLVYQLTQAGVHSRRLFSHQTIKVLSMARIRSSQRCLLRDLESSCQACTPQLTGSLRRVIAWLQTGLIWSISLKEWVQSIKNEDHIHNNCSLILNINIWIMAYYEKLRTVFEHHLDERIKGKQYQFPSPKNIMITPPSYRSSNSDVYLFSPRTLIEKGILKGPGRREDSLPGSRDRK